MYLVSAEGPTTSSLPFDEAEKHRWVVPAAWFFVGLGIAVRLVRFFVNYPIWHDEAFLAVNFWDRSYTDLLRPLDYAQVAPWLFLAIERTATTWLGYSEPACVYSPRCVALSACRCFITLPVAFWAGRLDFLPLRSLRFRFIRSATEPKSSLTPRTYLQHSS